MSRMSDTESGNSNSASDQIKDKAAQIGKNVRETTSQISDAAREKYEHLRDQARDSFEQGREQAQYWEERLERFVQEEPVKALLIAAGVGALVGMLWRRH
jgi:ElaB/YqjD/DUF883 family membrane-anchored ribosome-binding protein